MNIKRAFKEGQNNEINKGLSLGKEAISLDKVLNGLQKGRIYGLASAPKVGKTTLVDDFFVINPILDAIKKKIDFHIIYLSYEISRIEKEFDFATYFLYHFYNIRKIKLENQTFNKEDIINLSPDYLKGRLIDDNNNLIKVKEPIKQAFLEIIDKYIIPFFGDYNEEGILLKRGYITFIEERDNPTGIYKNILKFAEKRGKIIKKEIVKGKFRKVGYIPNSKNEIVLIITDHLRKLIRERNFTLKENIDKYIEYSVDLKKLLNYSFIHILHLNRNVTDINRITKMGKYLYPNSDDVKDTGNLSEEADYMFTIFNPNDDRYNLREHFDLKIKDKVGNNLYPNLRTLHLVESRHCYYPQHFRFIFEGNLKKYLKFNK